MKEKISVLMIAPHPDKTLGGMSSVIKNYNSSDLKRNLNYKFLASAVDGTKIQKISIFICSYIKALIILLFCNIDIIHIHSASRGSFIRKSYFVKLSKFFKKKIILHIHGAEFEQYYKNECSKKQQLYIRNTFNLCDLVIALGDEWKKKIQEYCDVEILVLNNAIKIPNENLYNINSNNITLLGRLDKRKGTFDVIESAKDIKKKYPKLKIVLAGDGDIEKVKLKIKEYGLEDTVSVLGWINESKRNQILKDTKIYILPSYNEGMPMSILEAMSYGIPVISSNVGSIPTLIKNGINGYLIEAGDTKSLANNILKLVENKNLRNIISKNNYSEVKEKFSIESNIEKLIKIYNKILDKDFI
ncbi:glycosyltransferase family 4 protein [Clostridium botulinum]|uniref:glycosyltransferase family 4 protein n=1 Tax=Clostridium botulinum TaxID=1491 RepID=UPI0013FE6BA3|nr:glycosyltransferase family 4 protein [Clostridium botulinum]MBY6839007.1 glycosyltransferase family 4 protein [Clostridium botulinum]NFG65039.1 glycosyltransferase family 4 protein [Clostridium botulinum]NFQ25038.1 glycosyltransferase family 4 protein [Clostridium botulinum]